MESRLNRCPRSAAGHGVNLRVKEQPLASFRQRFCAPSAAKRPLAEPLKGTNAMTSNSAKPTAVRYYAFGHFVVDVHRRLLFRDGKVVPLTSKPFDVLLILIQERERIVDKDEFLQRVWPNTFVQESTLVQRISILRKTFGLRPEDHDVIVTVTGRGYQFVATVEELAHLPQSPDVSKPDRPEDLLGTNHQEGGISETVEAEESLSSRSSGPARTFGR